MWRHLPIQEWLGFVTVRLQQLVRAMPAILVRLAKRMPTGIPIAGLASHQEAYLRLAADAAQEGVIFLLEVKNSFHVPTALVRERLFRLKEKPGEPPVD